MLMMLMLLVAEHRYEDVETATAVRVDDCQRIVRADRRHLLVMARQQTYTY
jgi:hypothetical protein